MRRGFRLLVLCSLAALPLRGAAWAATPQPETREAAASLEGRLEIKRMDARRVEGRFSNRYADGLSFRTLKDGRRGEVVLRSDALGELLHVSEDPDTVTLSVYNGAARTIIDMRIVRESARQGRLPEAERKPFPVARGVRQEGDEQAFERFTLSPEARALPWLSRALGQKGFTGRQAPSSLPLHHLALRVAGNIGEFPTPLPQPDAPAAAGAAATASASCLDLRPDPYGDKALGMCGPGLTCWDWLCGDCCCHDGCRAHDKACRNCKWYRPWNCILCWSGAAFLLGACDTSCQDRDFAEGRVIYSGEICGGATPDQDARCAGEHQDSSESWAAPQQWMCLPAEPGVFRCQLYDPCSGLADCELTRCTEEQLCDTLRPPLADDADPQTRAQYDQERSQCFFFAERAYNRCVSPIGIILE